MGPASPPGLSLVSVTVLILVLGMWPAQLAVQGALVLPNRPGPRLSVPSSPRTREWDTPASCPPAVGTIFPGSQTGVGSHLHVERLSPPQRHLREPPEQSVTAGLANQPTLDHPPHGGPQVRNQGVGRAAPPPKPLGRIRPWGLLAWLRSPVSPTVPSGVVRVQPAPSELVGLSHICRDPTSDEGRGPRPWGLRPSRPLGDGSTHGSRPACPLSAAPLAAPSFICFLPRAAKL